MTIPARLEEQPPVLAQVWSRNRHESLVVAYIVTWLAVLIAGPTGRVASILLNVSYFGMAVLTLRQQVLVARRSGWDPRTRRAWAWLAASAAWLLVNGATWTAWLFVDPAARAADWSALLDAGYVPLAVIGLLQLPRNPRFTWRNRDVLFDGALLALGIGVLSWHFALRPLLLNAGEPLNAVSLAPVISEWVLALVAAVAYLRCGHPVMRRAVALALGGHVAYILSDFFWLPSRATYLPGNMVDAVWFLAWVLRWSSARMAWRARSPGGEPRAYRSGLTPALFVAGAYSLLLFSVLVDETAGSVDIAVAATIMTAVLLARQAVALAENRHLARRTAAQAARYRSLVSHAADFVMLVGEGQLVTYASPSVERALDAPTGATFTDLVHPDDREAARAWLDVLRGAHGAVAHRCRVRDASGSWAEVDLRGEDHRDDPQLRGIVINGRDISAEVALEGRLGHARKLATLSDMAGRIAHAFNNTLAVLQGHAELLADELPSGSDAADDVAAIRAAADRGAGITRQLLGFSGRHVMRPEVLEPRDLLGRLMPTMLKLLPASVRLHVSPGEAGDAVFVDRAQFEQVLVNLVTNARDAMPNGGDLFVSARVAPGPLGEPLVLIEVRDTGTGMPDAVRARLFEPFFTTKAPGRGTGLGLAMVDSIVRRAGGRVLVKTTEGAGSTFTVALPRVDRHSPRTPVAAPEVVPSLASGAILLVDDEPGVRRAARRMLERTGYVVHEAPDGEQAIAIAGQDTLRIDLLITDLLMPGVSGRDVIDAFRRRRPGVPIICMTGYAAEQGATTPLGPEVQFILAKPFTAAALTSAVAGAMARSVEPAGDGA